MSDKDNSIPKNYPNKNIRPTFNNRLDKLKFLIKEYKYDFEVEKTKSNKVFGNFLKTSIHNIENEIINTLTEIQTKEMNEKEEVKRGENCKKLNNIKTEFELKLKGLGNKINDDEYEDFLDFYDEIDEKLDPLKEKKLVVNHLEKIKRFNDYVYGNKLNDEKRLSENITQKEKPKKLGYLFTTSLLADGSITANDKNDKFFAFKKEFISKSSLYKYIRSIYKNEKIHHQYIGDTLNKSGTKNVLGDTPNMPILQNTIEYCKENNIEIIESYQKKYDNIITKNQ